jgi:hypothetical protein
LNVPKRAAEDIKRTLREMQIPNHPKPKRTKVVKLKLDKYLRRMSRKAEEIFDDNGGIHHPVWFANSKNGQQHIIQTPFPDGSEPHKDAIAETMRQFLAEHDAVRYTMVCEAWGPRPKEIVAVYVADRTASLLGTREIIRPEGRKPYLGKLEVEDGPATGRFVNLLAPLPEPVTMIMKQFRLNGQPFSNPEVIHVQGDNPEDFPDELMAIQQPPENSQWDQVTIVPCRFKSGNQVEISQSVFCACIRSFVIDRNHEPPIINTSAPDRCHLKIPDTVVALVGQQVPNTENAPLTIPSEEVKKCVEVARTRWAAKRRMRAMN